MYVGDVSYYDIDYFSYLLHIFYVSLGVALAIIWLVLHRFCGENIAALHTNGPRYVQGGLLARDTGLRMTKDERRRVMEAALIQRRVTQLDIEEMKDIEAEIDPSCSICLAEYEENDAKLSSAHCDHCFHTCCLLEWLQAHDDCPNCRKPVLTPSELQDAAVTVFTERQLSEIKGRPFDWVESSNDLGESSRRTNQSTSPRQTHPERLPSSIYVISLAI